MKCDLSFEFYGEWYRNLSTEHKEILEEHDMTPDIIRAAYNAKAATNPPKSALRDFRATVEYRAHYLTSPPHVQRELSRMGINENFRLRDDSHIESNRGDISDKPIASSRKTAADDAVEHESESHELCELFDVDEATARQMLAWRDESAEKLATRRLSDGIAVIVAVFLQEKNLMIAAGAMAFAAGLNAINGLKSQSEFALSIGVTRSAISKRVRKYKKLLNLPTNSHMKSEEACKKYKKNGLSNHWRKKKFTVCNHH